MKEQYDKAARANDCRHCLHSAMIVTSTHCGLIYSPSRLLSVTVPATHRTFLEDSNIPNLDLISWNLSTTFHITRYHTSVCSTQLSSRLIFSTLLRLDIPSSTVIKMFKVATVASSICLLLGSFAPLASAQEKFYPISTITPGTMAPVQPQNTVAKRVHAVTYSVVNVEEPLATAHMPTLTTQNTNAKRFEDITALPISTVGNVERFFPCGTACPAPYPNSLYTPPARPNPVPSTMVQRAGAVPDTKCQEDDKPMKGIDPNTNVTYYICCPTTMSQGTNWDQNRGLQCCSDQWKQECKHDPRNATDCGVDLFLIADALSHVMVCKDTGPNETVPTVPNPSSTTPIPSPTSDKAEPSTATETASSTQKSTTATKIGITTGGGARIRMYEMAMINAEYGTPAILLMMITFS